MQMSDFMEYARQAQTPDVHVSKHGIALKGQQQQQQQRRHARTSANQRKIDRTLKRTLREADKKAVAALQRWRCAKCVQLLPARFEVDHIVQFALGGGDHYTNLQALCPACHSLKTEMDRRLGRLDVWKGCV